MRPTGAQPLSLVGVVAAMQQVLPPSPSLLLNGALKSQRGNVKVKAISSVLP